MGLCVFSPQMYAHVEQKSNTICPTDQTDKPNDGEVKRGRPICFYRSFVSLFNFIPPYSLPPSHSTPTIDNLPRSSTIQMVHAKHVNSTVTIYANFPLQIVLSI